MKELAPLLEYGLTGLAAILALLSYRLLVKESDKKTPRKAMLSAIKSFAILCIFLVLLSATLNAFEIFIIAKQKEDITELKKQLLMKDSEIHRLKDAGIGQESIGELEKKLVSANAEIKRLMMTSNNDNQLNNLRSQLDEAERIIANNKRLSKIEYELSTRYIADLLLTDFPSARIHGKVQAVMDTENDLVPVVTDRNEIHFRILKRAVFNHISDFKGDAGILKRALVHLEKRGYQEIQGNAIRLIKEYPSIMTMRLRWLEDKAIPELRHEIEFATYASQSGPFKSVSIPEALWLFKYPEGKEPTETVKRLADLQSEVRLIKEAL